MDNQSKQEIIIPQFKDVDQASLLTTQFGLDPASANIYRPGGAETIQIGTGFTVFNVDSQGMWMGDPRFSNAPFKVSMRGDMIANLSNSIGSPIADPIGLHSINNFTKSEITQEVDQTITGTDFVALTNLIYVIEGLPRSAMALIYAEVSGYHDDSDGRLEFQLYVNSQPIGSIFCLNQVADPTTPQTAQVMIPATLNAGDNGISILARSSNANSGVLTGTIIPARLGYLLLGK